MKHPRAEKFRKTGGKWSAVSTTIRNLYDSVLKESVPHTLRASTKLNSPRDAEETPIETQPSNTSEITESGLPSVGVMEASDTSNAPINVERGEAPSPLPDQSNIKTGDSKN